MNEFLLSMATPMIQNIVAELLKPENIQTYGDKLFDFVEDAVVNSETTIDDALVLPMVKQLRTVLNIPDND